MKISAMRRNKVLMLLVLPIVFIAVYILNSRLSYMVKDDIMKYPPILWNHSLSDGECERYFSGTLPLINVSKVPIKEEVFLETKCESIFSRGFYSKKPTSAEEASFPIAFARVVYKEYFMHELLLNLMYAPQNHYCFAVDAKSTKLFKEQMKNLSKCFTNVYVVPYSYEVESSGSNVLRSLFECIKLLMEFPDWKYLITLENYDIPLRTNREMVQVLSLLNGANDVITTRKTPGQYPKAKNWRYNELHLFRDKTLHFDESKMLNLSKGGVQCSLSRAFVDFIMKTLDLTVLLDRIENGPFASNEVLFSSLNSDDGLDAPGGFTQFCLINGTETAAITRFALWASYPEEWCPICETRHAIKLVGLNELHYVKRLPFLFLNKMVAAYDYLAISCWARKLYNRTHFFNENVLNTKFYENLPQVRFNKERAKWRKNITGFVCNPSLFDAIKFAVVNMTSSKTNTSKNKNISAMKP